MLRGGVLAACLLALVTRLPTGVAAGRQPRNAADVSPFVTLITTKEAPLCTGALVGSQAVLTAASCVTGGGRPELVFVGVFNAYLDPFRRPGAYEILRVEKVVVHPNFTSKGGSPQHNLALLLLDRASRKQPVALPGAVFAYPTNAMATALGFGSLTADGFWPQLHADAVEVLPGEECSGLQAAFSAEPDGLMHHACTGVSSSFRACAAGNVGAPLLMPGESSSSPPLQLGLLTAGFGCSSDSAHASASSPALFTWLPRYAGWLGEQLGSL